MISDQLNRRENEVMGAMFALADGKERFLAAPYEIISMLPPKADRSVSLTEVRTP